MKKKKHKKKKIIVWSVLVFFSFLTIMIVLNINEIKQIIYLYNDANTKVESISENTFKSRETSYIYDNKKNVINKLYDSKDVDYIPYNKIPELATQAFIAIEDKDFFKHHGVSIKAIGRAAYSIIKNQGEITQGGSTITQQLVKNVFLTQEQSMNRKIEEMFIALKLEHMYSKEQILEFYINNIYFDNNAYGMESASKKYFNKDISDLDLSQIAFLAAIPNNPEYYNPLKNENNTIERRNLILSNMKDLNFITDSQYNSAVSEDIVLNPEKSYKKQNSINSYALFSAAQALMSTKGFTFKNDFKDSSEQADYNNKYSELYTQCTNELYKNGYRIYTSIDLDKQSLLQQTIDEKLSSFTEKQNGIYSLQGAAVTIDNKTGNVVAIVGGRSSDKNDFLNRGFQSYRQPGSSIKPLIVYTPAFEKEYSPSSIIVDQYIEGGPHNDDNKYEGAVNLRYATQRSINTVAYQLFQKITPNYGLSFLKNMDFKKIDSRDYNLAASLGGLTKGVSPLEMASAYSTLERGGQFISPSCITEITDSSGNTIYKNDAKTKDVYSKDAAYLMTDVLKGVLEEPFGTGYNIKLSNMTAAGKTGTTDDSKDGWFCGYTPYYTTSIWVGYDKPKTLDNLFGATYPGGIWHSYMEQINADLSNIDFEKPDTIKEAYVNKYTGKRVDNNYPGAVKELFSQNNLPPYDGNNYKNTTDTQKNVPYKNNKKSDKMSSVDTNTDINTESNYTVPYSTENKPNENNTIENKSN
ncbi:penicillin-binding protein [Clostridium sp. P21]|uniref:Penicillin-binding protein 1A n=1 Tax=Clostridium muellerianum TaxID=2716538 RepID=A0A7Y0EH97_9CLOT|nr:transglycosylase domain-containing protein [Clostridium muellerianum]NMM63352.1 penicillin-binding protein [Clostridium muellerianum]